MTSRSVRRLRVPSKLRPTSASASSALRATHSSWSKIVDRYRQWAELPRRDRPEPPVHLAWVESFDAFVDDMGLRPGENLALTRINPKLPYRPDNCCWAQRPTSGRGRPAKWRVDYQGDSISIHEFCARQGLVYKTVYNRIRQGIAPEVALGLTSECG
jgi:hypothetical protein